MKFGIPILILVTCCVLHTCTSRNVMSDDARFGVIIDVGSTGSRVRIYRWHGNPYNSVPKDVEEVSKYKVRPGFSSLVHNISAIHPYVIDLLDNAKDFVPQEAKKNTPIYFLATAGMRLLLEPHAAEMMDAVDGIFRDASVNPFHYDHLHTRILSGEEEGAFAWIAANYLRGYFTQGSMDQVGILELGGASTQIAFVPDVSPLAGKFPVRLGGVTYPLYVHSYLNYGQEAIYRWTSRNVVQLSSGTGRPLSNPCVLSGDQKQISIDEVTYTLTGGSDPEACEALLDTMIYEVDPVRCQPKPCAIGPFYQPSIPENVTFYAMAAFYHPIPIFNLQSPEGVVRPSDFRAAAREYCHLSLSVALARADLPTEYASARCLVGLYAPKLFTKAYGFHPDSEQIVFLKTLGENTIDWALGAIIYETSRDVSHNEASVHRCLHLVMLLASVAQRYIF